MKKLIAMGLAMAVSLGVMGQGFSVYADQSITSDDLFGHEGVYASAPTLEQMLVFALEDEHLALASYEAIVEKFNVTRPFTNIMKAELQHIKAIEGLMNTYNIPVPDVTNTAQAEVSVPDTLAEIFQAGVQAEIYNIDLYESFLEQDLPADVRAVFEALMKASQNHQKAFERNSSRRR